MSLCHVVGASRRLVYASMGLLFAGTAWAQQGPPPDAKIVYVNVQQVVQQAPGAEAARSTFDQELAQFRQELQAMATAVDSMVQEYQKQEVMLSPQAKTAKQQEILGKQQQLQTRQQELETQAGQRQQELLQPILERVSAVIEEIRAENGYYMVVDVTDAGIVAADSRLDITQLVNQRVQAAGQANSGG